MHVDSKNVCLILIGQKVCAKSSTIGALARTTFLEPRACRCVIFAYMQAWNRRQQLAVDGDLVAVRAVFASRYRIILEFIFVFSAMKEVRIINIAVIIFEVFRLPSAGNKCSSHLAPQLQPLTSRLMWLHLPPSKRLPNSDVGFHREVQQLSRTRSHNFTVTIWPISSSIFSRIS